MAQAIERKGISGTGFSLSLFERIRLKTAEEAREQKIRTSLAKRLAEAGHKVVQLPNYIPPQHVMRPTYLMQTSDFGILSINTRNPQAPGGDSIRYRFRDAIHDKIGRLAPGTATLNVSPSGELESRFLPDESKQSVPASISTKTLQNILATVKTGGLICVGYPAPVVGETEYAPTFNLPPVEMTPGHETPVPVAA